MVENYKKALIALAIFASTPAYADDVQVANAPPQSVSSALPSKPQGFWDLFAFELGTGRYNVPNEQYDTHIGFTLGVGRRVGDGSLLLRYNTHTDWDPFSQILVDVGCAVFSVNSCLLKSVKYEEYGLIYHQRVGYFALGLGAGAVSRKVEVADLNTNPQQTETVSTNRAAVFYELMLNVPINRENKTSVSFGIQGQHNKDYPSHSILLTLEKGI